MLPVTQMELARCAEVLAAFAVLFGIGGGIALFFQRRKRDGS